MVRCVNDGVTTIKPGHQTTGNTCVIWSDVILQAVPYNRKSVCLENTQGNPQCGMHGSNSETRGRFCDGLDSNITVQYSVGPIIILHGQITAREYVDRSGNQVHPMIQTLFPKKDTVFQDDNAPFSQLFSHGLKSMKVNSTSSLISTITTFDPDQHNHHI
jgi:hypothetical protein